MFGWLLGMEEGLWRDNPFDDTLFWRSMSDLGVLESALQHDDG